MKNIEKEYRILREKYDLLYSAVKQPDMFQDVGTSTGSVTNSVPTNYRGWTVNRRKTSSGKTKYNLQKHVNKELREHIGHEKIGMYLGEWNQEKADRLIDNASEKFGFEIIDGKMYPKVIERRLLSEVETSRDKEKT